MRDYDHILSILLCINPIYRLALKYIFLFSVVTKPQQQGKASKTKLILMIVMIGLATISVIMLIYCVWRRTNKRNGTFRPFFSHLYILPVVMSLGSKLFLDIFVDETML